MKLAINAVPLMSPLTGIGQYVRCLSASLLQQGQVEMHFFYGIGWSQEIRHQGLPTSVNRLKLAVRKNLPRSYELSRWLQQKTFNRGVKENSPNLYHEPSFLSYEFDGPIVLTVHDLSWIRHPRAHPPERVRAMNKYFEPSLARATQIITDTAFIKQELVDIFGVNPSRIHAIPLAADAIYKPLTACETIILLKQKGLTYGSYWLTVGTLEPRKNLTLALEAFSALPTFWRKKCPLVLAGMVGWGEEGAMRKISAMEQAGELIQLGYVDQKDLATVIAGAKALVFPSIYEGFGLPLIEAMQCGTPVIASTASCLPEVLGEAGLLFNPRNADDLAQQMKSLAENADLQKVLRDMGLNRSKSFSWQKTANQTLEVYKLALN